MTSGMRLNAILDANSTLALKAQADKKGVSYTEIVRRSLLINEYISDEIAKGNKIFIYDPATRTQRVVVFL